MHGLQREVDEQGLVPPGVGRRARRRGGLGRGEGGCEGLLPRSEDFQAGLVDLLGALAVVGLGWVRLVGWLVRWEERKKRK